MTAVNSHVGVDYYARVQDIFGVERGKMAVHNEGFRKFASNA